MSEAENPTTILGKLGKQVGAEVKTVNQSLSTHKSATNPHNITKSSVGLSLVENTALSSWAGSANITTVGTLSTGSIPYSLISGKPNLSEISSVSGNFTIAGDLTVNGETTTLNTQTLSVEDNIIEVNLQSSDGTTTASTAGLEVNRGAGNTETQIEATAHPDGGFVAPTSSDIDSWTYVGDSGTGWQVDDGSGNVTTSVLSKIYTYVDGSNTTWTLRIGSTDNLNPTDAVTLTPTYSGGTDGTEFQIGTYTTSGTDTISLLDGWGITFVDPGVNKWQILLNYTPVMVYPSNLLSWTGDSGLMSKTSDSLTTFEAFEDPDPNSSVVRALAATYQVTDANDPSITWTVTISGGEIRLQKGSSNQLIGTYIPDQTISMNDGWSIDFQESNTSLHWQISLDHEPIVGDGDKASLIWDENSGQGFWKFALGSEKADLKAKDITASKVTVDSGDNLILGYDANNVAIPLGTVAAFSASLASAKT